MTVAQEIVAALGSAKHALCDDCLTSRARLARRQVAFAYTTRLAAEGVIEREKGPCAACQKTFKNVSWIEKERPPPLVPALADRAKAETISAPAGAPTRLGPARLVQGYPFEFVTGLEPDRAPDGSLMEFWPEVSGKYAASELHAEGRGPFIRLRVGNAKSAAGVYLVSSGEDVLYVGEAADFALRWNMGYGQISPRNCFRGGQTTNCRLNKLIRDAVREGRRLHLSFFETPDYKAIEAELIAALQPPWNRKGIRSA